MGTILKNNKNTIVFSGFILLIIALLFMFVKSCDDAKMIEEKGAIINSLNAEMKKTKNSDGTVTVEKPPIVTSSVDDYLKLKLTGENAELQKEVEKYKKLIKDGGSVTKVTSNTNVSATVKTKVDTTIVKNDKNEDVIKPVYKSDFDLNGWVKGQTIASADSTKIDLKIKNAYTVVIGEKSTGFLGLGKKEPIVKITDENPYTEPEKMNTVVIDKRKKNKTWIYALAIGLVAGFAVAK